VEHGGKRVAECKSEERLACAPARNRLSLIRASRGGDGSDTEQGRARSWKEPRVSGAQQIIPESGGGGREQRGNAVDAASLW